MAEQKKIGVVGLGIMGAGMARNYLKHGYSVYVWNRSQDKVEALVSDGAIACPSPRDASEQADIVFEVTASDESSRSVWLGEQGILAGAKAGSTLISSGTLSVNWTDELATLCADKGFTYFDIPLTGGRRGAEEGKLFLLIGGDEAKLETLKPDLAAISTSITYFGKAGSGARYKLILNALQAVHIIGLGEALKLARKSGLDERVVGDALAEYPGGVITARTWSLHKSPSAQTNFAVKWLAKDLNYANDMAGELDLPLLHDVLAKYKEAVERGLGDADYGEAMKV